MRVPALAAAALLLAVSASGAPARPEILVFAAASLSDALAEVGRAFEAAGGGRVAFNFAASNDLARQIAAGAPADVFVSANREQVERLERSGQVRPGTAFALLANRLVVVVPRDGPGRALAGPRDLLAFDRLALADPEAVPAGIYARAWLERAGVWGRLAPRVVPALDVRAALAAVAAGNVPAGIVYATDATSSDRVRVAYRVPADATPDVRYYVAPLAQEPQEPQEAKDAPPLAGWLAFLRGEKAREVFARHGFVPLDVKGPPPASRPPAAARRRPGG